VISLDEERSLATNVQGREQPPPASSSPPPPQLQRPPVAEDERSQTRKNLVREIKRIDAWTNNLIDNGLFE
jgi:hypothetical protein